MRQKPLLTARVVRGTVSSLTSQYKKIPGDKGIPFGKRVETVMLGPDYALTLLSPACLIANAMLRNDKSVSERERLDWLLAFRGMGDTVAIGAAKLVFLQNGLSPAGCVRILLRDGMLVDEPNPLFAHTSAVAFIRALGEEEMLR